MNADNLEPLKRAFTIQIDIPSTDQIPESLTVAFTHCSAEAQMLEHAIKSAIAKDVGVFGKTIDPISFLETFKKITLGGAKHITFGTSSKKDQKKFDACIGFFTFIKMQWNSSGRAESELSIIFNDATNRRNRLAHQLLADFFCSADSISDALAFLKDSKERFFELRQLVIAADVLSSKMGSVGSDGSSLSRFKTTTELAKEFPPRHRQL